MMKPISDDTALFLHYSPYFALLEGKTPEQTAAFDAAYDALPETVRQFLLSPEASDSIAGLVQSGAVPSSHVAAVAKLLGMVVMGDVQTDQVAPLLTKLGLPAQSVSAISQRFSEILKPIIAARVAQAATENGMRPIKPLTRTIGQPPTAPVPGFRPTPNTVVDLRNRPQT